MSVSTGYGLPSLRLPHMELAVACAGALLTLAGTSAVLHHGAARHASGQSGWRRSAPALAAPPRWLHAAAAHRSANPCRLAATYGVSIGPALARLAHAGTPLSFDPAAVRAVLRVSHGRHAHHLAHLRMSLGSLNASGIAAGDADPVATSASDRLAADPDDALPAAELKPIDHPADPTAVGPFTTGAKAGFLDGAPAASLDVGTTLSGIHLDAAGTTDVSDFVEPSSVRKIFKVETVASIPFD